MTTSEGPRHPAAPGANRRVLAVMPHPDDMEILAAGTLLRLAALGFEVHVATMTAGDKGSDSLSMGEIGAVRLEEARRGASAVGATSYRCLGFRDLEIFFDDAARRAVTGLLRAVDPFLVLTTPPHDYMLDHELTSLLVRDACLNAVTRNYSTGEPGRSSRVPYLYYTDPVTGRDMHGDPARATTRLDITAVMREKEAALECHASQREWLRAQQGVDDYLLSMRSWCASRGREIGVEYAEAFCQHRGHPHPADDVLAKILG